METTGEQAGKAPPSTILIVDDNLANLEVVAEYLTQDGFQVMMARTGETGLALAQRDPPDLILLDIRLPGIDGIETCRRLKADETTREIPVVFMTIMDRAEDKVKGLAAGGVDYITKPFQVEEVLARCRMHLTFYQLQQNLRELNRTLEDRVTARTAELIQVNRAYQALSRCNQAMLHATGERELLNEICQVIQQECGYGLVWIGFAEQDDAKTVRPVAYASYEAGYLETAKITWADNERGQGPAGVAIRSGQLCISRDIQTDPWFAPWREAAIQRGYASTIALPLHGDDRVFGVLSVYSVVPDGFQTEEVELLMEIASDLAFGLNSLRERAERKRAEESLRESERRYRDIFDNVLDGLYLLDVTEDGRFRTVEVNPALERLTGISRSQSVGKTQEEIVPEEVAQVVNRKYRRCVEAGQPLEEEVVLDLPTGQRLFYSVLVPARDETGRVNRIIGISRDITERKQIEETRRERDRFQVALEKEREISAIRNNLMRTISHEFRTPLAVISSASSLLTHYYERLTSEQRQERLQTIEEQVHKLDQMLEEIVSAVRGIFSDFTLHPIPTDLELLGRLAVTELQSTIGARHDMIFECEGQLQNVLIDERLVKRILINLLSNAIKYSPEGRLICLRIIQAAETLVIQVIDQGIGISTEDQKRLFVPFFRASNVAAISGIGLGLSIVRDCVSLHQGTITLESELNKGTTFTVALPMQPRLLDD